MIGEGIIELSDGAKLKFVITIIDAKEVGPSPFGGVNIDVNVIGGVSTKYVPEELVKAVRDKPLAPLPPPMEGWELLDIVDQQQPTAEVMVDTSKGKFKVKVTAEVVMAARNSNFKTVRDEPIYWVSWVYKISWRPGNDMSLHMEVERHYHMIARNPTFDGILEQLLFDRTVKDQALSMDKPPTVLGPWPPLLTSSTIWNTHELALWPEVCRICVKLVGGIPLEAADEAIVGELSEALGWRIGDVKEDLKLALRGDPSAGANIYLRLVKEYYNEAVRKWERGDLEQAGEKLWGASVALVKLHAALKGVFIARWSRGKLDSYITHNVEREHKSLFRDLLDNTSALHEYFYEGVPDGETFKERWIKAIDLFVKASEAVRISLT